MTPRAWDLARRYAVDVVPPDPAALRNGVEALAGGIRRIGQVLADYDAAGLEPPVDARLAELIDDARTVAGRTVVYDTTGEAVLRSAVGCRRPERAWAPATCSGRPGEPEWGMNPVSAA
jgi:hypothetical protein